MTEPTELKTNDARAGREAKGMRTVLTISIVAAVILIAAAAAFMSS